LQVFRLALDSGEYVQIRNALIVLNKIVKVRHWLDNVPCVRRLRARRRANAAAVAALL